MIEAKHYTGTIAQKHNLCSRMVNACHKKIKAQWSCMLAQSACENMHVKKCQLLK